ncbi:MAG: calcium-binding protein [Alphaproteobacteria bacterium]|jgi:hypothetical protein|nr:calcium-binding protein [Alphaproteobacteria bacterium]
MTASINVRDPEFVLSSQGTNHTQFSTGAEGQFNPSPSSGFASVWPLLLHSFHFLEPGPLEISSDISTEGATRVVTGGSDDRLILDAGADEVHLGSGDDQFRAGGPVRLVVAGSADDSVILEAGAEEVVLGSGDDLLEAAGAVERVRSGSGDDIVRLSTANGQVDGGSGEDSLFLAQPLNAFDVLVEEDTVSLADRMTGDVAQFTQFEAFTFENGSYSFERLVENFGPNAFPKISVARGTQFTTVNDFDPSVNVVWDRAAQQAVIETEISTGPTVASRAYGMVHTAIYDAWASYDPTAVRVSFDAAGNNEDLEAGLVATDANKNKAMSYAAYQVLLDLFPDQKPLFDTIMTERYGLDPAGDGSPEAGVGADAAADLLALRRMDGSNQLNGYVDTTGYEPVNKGPDQVVDITRWTPENVPIDSADDSTRQEFLSPHWPGVESFGLPETAGSEQTDFESLGVPAPQPFFLDAFAESELNLDAKTVELSAPVTIDGVDYAAGDTLQVSKALIGEVIAPRFISQAEEIVEFNANLTDRQKLIAEFWEDAGGTAFPPGTFMTFAQVVSARDGNSVDEDAKMFFAMGNAVMDAGISAWWTKVEFDYARPVRAIRELGKLELIGEPGVDELTGEEGYVIEAFAGYDPETSIGLGTKTILAENFVTYQRPFSNPSPPFAEYVSGHSTFSAAGAEVLRQFTGSEEFGASVTFQPGASQFDPSVPAEPITLSWDTFEAASDEAGISRRYGNIHFEDADLVGRRLGEDVGAGVYELAEQFIDGTVPDVSRPFFEEWDMIG